MSGVLKAKVGGVWVPVGTPGPPGPQGVPGPGGSVPTASVKARGFCASMAPSAALNTGKTVIAMNSVTLNDGFSVYSPTIIKAIAAGRFRVSAHLTVVGGTAGNWMIFGLSRRRWVDSVELQDYAVVAQNTSTGYRMANISVVMELNAEDWVYCYVQPDVGGATIDGRSWYSISEVAW